MPSLGCGFLALKLLYFGDIRPYNQNKADDDVPRHLEKYNFNMKLMSGELYTRFYRCF